MYRQEPQGERIVVKSSAGEEHTILTRTLNLDKERSLNILKSDFGFELRSTLWVLLLYMRDMEPLCYLVPSTVFATRGDMFVDHEQPGRFRHLSHCEIKVFVKAIPELSRYALDTAVIS